MKKTPPYTLELHSHRFACWTAGRGASVKGCRFKVKVGKQILEEAGFTASFKLPDGVPSPVEMDELHAQWRDEVIKVAKPLKMTHGVAGKLINIYLKTRFIVGGDHADPWVPYLHPPIDGLLLEALADNDIGGYSEEWNKLVRKRWSKLSRTNYEHTIGLIRKVCDGEALWKIEYYWQGYQ